MNLSKTPSKIFFLGPNGTFTYMAQMHFSEILGFENSKKIPVCSISKAFEFLIKTENSAIVLPLENSIEGVVRETIDNLISLENTNYKIISEHIISVKQNLIGFSKENIKTIISHPQAISQCRRFLTQNYPEVELRYVNSTSNAISSLSTNDPSSAAIGSEFCANLYNIPVLEKEINDEKNNQTRFVLIGSQTTKMQKDSKTAITFTTSNTPGALNKILSIFEKYNINMTQIESRPSKKSLGNYTFFIEIDGHFQDDLIIKALFEVIGHTCMFKHLGSYSVI